MLVMQNTADGFLGVVKVGAKVVPLRNEKKLEIHAHIYAKPLP